MTRFKWLLCVLLLAALFGTETKANTVQAASCNSSAVQSAINSAAEGDIVIIPAGICTWTSGVSISGKGITVQGTGAGRVIGVSIANSAIPLSTGSVSFPNVIAATVAGVLSNAQPAITIGQTLRIVENGFLGNFMQGTVTSFSGGTLVMNITSEGGTCGTVAANAMNSNCKRWLISTPSSTVLANNLTSGAMFTITEDTSAHTTITGIRFAQGSSGGGAGNAINLNRNNPSGVAVLIHDNFFDSNQSDIINANTNRGVIWNNSFVFSPFSAGQWATIRIKDANNTALPTSWSTVSTMGVADVTGENNLYFETNDIHAVGSGTDFDDNARAVMRYNFLNNAGGSTHGADTSAIGMRHLEYYNNAGIFQAYGDGSTANMNWWMFIRGGTFVWHDNTLPAISSQDWGSKADIATTVMTLQREDQYACWGAGGAPGQYYPAPRQIGFGRVTGSGKVSYPPLGYNNSGTPGGVYAGDSEPVYVWNNNRTMIFGIGDYGLGNGSTSCPATPTPDTASNYVIPGRDFFNNGTAKPGYTPYTYPHPLTLGQSSGNPPAPPTNLTAAVQ